jgi:ketosteroid isomerase-like protein
MFFFDAE